MLHLAHGVALLLISLAVWRVALLSLLNPRNLIHGPTDVNDPFRAHLMIRIGATSDSWIQFERWATLLSRPRPINTNYWLPNPTHITSALV
jgi:hypothetical protein